jgi:ADP-ribose pyrophosphatase YjhB (NUDIX family)
MTKGKDFIGVGVGAVILNDKSEILLLLRNKNPESNHWSIPGGSVEFYETIEDAVMREILEETSVKIELVKLLGVTNHIVVNEGAHWIAPTFLAKIIEGTPINVETQKHADLKWFSLNDLPENITITTLKALEFLSNQSA